MLNWSYMIGLWEKAIFTHSSHAIITFCTTNFLQIIHIFLTVASRILKLNCTTFVIYFQLFTNFQWIFPYNPFFWKLFNLVILVFDFPRMFVYLSFHLLRFCGQSVPASRVLLTCPKANSLWSFSSFWPKAVKRAPLGQRFKDSQVVTFDAMITVFTQL